MEEKFLIFFGALAKDDRIHAFHITLYMALFQKWNLNDFQNPISVSRREIMRMSKIKGIATYHKYMKELCAFGYIGYEPSYHPKMGSKVWIKDI
jgi:hypothetical protein